MTCAWHIGTWWKQDDVTHNVLYEAAFGIGALQLCRMSETRNNLETLLATVASFAFIEKAIISTIYRIFSESSLKTSMKIRRKFWENSHSLGPVRVVECETHSFFDGVFIWAQSIQDQIEITLQSAVKISVWFLRNMKFRRKLTFCCPLRILAFFSAERYQYENSNIEQFEILSEKMVKNARKYSEIKVSQVNGTDRERYISKELSEFSTLFLRNFWENSPVVSIPDR